MEWQAQARPQNRLSDFRLRNKVLPQIVKEVEEKQERQLASAKDWTLVLDGWTDKSKNSIYAVMMVNHNEQHYLGNLELTFMRHTADNIREQLKILVGTKMELVGGICTDNATVIEKMRKDLCLEFPGIVDMGCVLHVHNLVCKDFVNCSLIEEQAKDINTLVSFFANSHFWRPNLVKWATEYNVGKFLKKYAETRWYSYILMAQTVKTFENGFKHCLALSEKKENPSLGDDIKKIINSNIFDAIIFHLRLLKPLGDSIACLERRTVSINETWIAFHKIHRFYRSVSEDTMTVSYQKVMKFTMARLRAITFVPYI